jgi:predicted ester cyclase
MSIRDVAFRFVDACDTGKGWSTCREWCHDGASFSCQADALAEVSTVETYVDWMAGLLGPIPDGRYELKSLAVDEERGNVSIFAVFHGTNTSEGPVPPTGKSIAADYVYVLEFDDGRIRNMTKIWNDAHSLKQLGWA